MTRRVVQAGLLVLAFTGVSARASLAQLSAKQQEQADKCDVARAAYGGDPGACLVVLFDWPAKEAARQAAVFRARDAALVDSLEREARRLWDSLQRADARINDSLADEMRRRDPIVADPGDIFPPTPRYTILPPLPSPSSLRGRTIRIHFWVNAQGRVTRVEIDPDIKDLTYRRQFVTMMMEYTFSPARRVDGTAVAGELTMPLTL